MNISIEFNNRRKEEYRVTAVDILDEYLKLILDDELSFYFAHDTIDNFTINEAICGK